MCRILNPPENAVVLYVDEKTEIQSLDRRQTVLSMIIGNAKYQITTGQINY